MKKNSDYFIRVKMVKGYRHYQIRKKMWIFSKKIQTKNGKLSAEKRIKELQEL